MSPEEAVSLFEIDRATGELFWKQRAAKCVQIGQPAGAIKADGYKVVTYRRKSYPAHRIVWALVHGRWPEHLLDHINGVRTDNRPENLREADYGVNSQNRRAAQRNNLSSGFLGVHFFARTGRWRAAVTIGGKYKHIGFFSSPEEAHAAYLAKKRELHLGCTL